MANDSERSREVNRLKQLRHRKRNRAEREGLELDHYITADDYIAGNEDDIPATDDVSEQGSENGDRHNELLVVGGSTGTVGTVVFWTLVVLFMIGYAWMNKDTNVANDVPPLATQQSPGVPVRTYHAGSGVYGNNPYS